MINGKKFTITWNVDDLKLSHVGKKVVNKIIDWMKSLFGNGMQISKVKKHDYLGMNLYFLVKGKVTVTMVDYMKGIIYDFE